MTEPSSSDAGSDPRPIFATAARSLAAVVATVRDDQWDRPGLGVWDVRSLVGHALRGVTTSEEYLANPADDITIPDTAAYLAVALSTPGIHDAVAERGRQGGLALGGDPARVVGETVDRVVRLVEATPLDTRLTLPFGSMAFGNYLTTRITEVVTHTDDLCRAIGHAPVATEDEVRVVLGMVVGSVDAASGLAIIRAAMGRGPLPDGFNLWG